MHRLHLYILTLFLFSASFAYADMDSIGKVKYNLENGLPSNNIYSILQDHNGYIWFATDNGVVKYNGYSYRVFNTNDGLPASDVWKLFEDKFGRIWFYCYSNEIGYVKNDVCHKLNYKYSQIRRINSIWEANDNVMIEVMASGTYILCKVDSQDVITTINLPYLNWPVHYSSFERGFLVNINKVMYMVKGDGYRIHFKRQARLEDYIKEIGLSHIYYLKDGICVSYENDINRIYRRYMPDFRTDTIFFKDLGGSDSEKIFTTEFLDTTIRFYTNKAAYLFNSSLDLIKRQSFSGIAAPKQQIANYYPDKTGNIWISTNSLGSFMLPGFKLYLKADTILNRITQPKCVGTLKDGSTYWWSTVDKKLLGIDIKGKVCLSDMFVDDELLNVRNFGSDKMLLFFSHNLLEYNLRTKKYKPFLDKRKVYLSGMIAPFEQIHFTGRYFSDSARMYDSMAPRLFYEIMNAVEYKPYRFLFAAAFLNVYSLNIADSIVSLKRIAEGRYPEALIDSPSGTYLFYNKKGILIIDPDNLHTTIIGDRLLSLLHSNSILGMYIDRYHNVYLHLDNKLVAYNIVTKWMTEIPVNIKLTDAHIEVHKDRLIFSGNFGLAYMNIKGPLSFGDLYIAPNIKGSWYNRVYQMVINNADKISLVTDKGVFSYSVDSLVQKGGTYNGYNNDVLNLVLSSPYSTRIKPFDTVSIAPGLQSVAFDFINYYGSGNRYFVYKIDNVSDWQKTTTGEVLITDLDPDKEYVVRIYVVDEMWKSEPITFYLYKQPHWYETAVWIRIFWVLAVLLTILVIGLIVLITRFYVNQANRKRSKLLDLELRAVYSQINPHFIFNTLSSALFFISKKELDEAYTHVSKFSKLLRSYLKSSQERYSSLSEEVEMLRNYIELQQTRFERKFIFEINIENKIPADNIRIPSLLLQPLVENAINHGLFHKQGEGHLSINFLQGRSNNELICTIEDDGVGRLRASEINRESTVRHDSYGTKLTQKLIEIFKEYEHMNIYLEYIDKKAPDTGTIVKLTLRNLKYDA